MEGVRVPSIKSPPLPLRNNNNNNNNNTGLNSGSVLATSHSGRWIGVHFILPTFGANSNQMHLYGYSASRFPKDCDFPCR